MFLKGPEKFSHPKSRSKISNLLSTKLFYSYVLNINRGSLHTRSLRRIHLFVFKYRLTKNGFSGPERFRGFRETGHWFPLLTVALTKIISNSNWTEWSTIQGVIARVISKLDEREARDRFEITSTITP